MTARIRTLRAASRGPATTTQTAEEIRTALGKASDEDAKAVREYERAHKDRAGVLEAAERELATA